MPNIFELLGPESRNWIHVMHRTAAAPTLCGFTAQDRRGWIGNPIWDVETNGKLADCPDCLRKYLEIVERGGV